jgi:predicted phosphoribosyltransferase
MQEAALSREQIIERIIRFAPTRPVLNTETQRIVLFDQRTAVGEAMREAAVSATA